MWIEGEIYVLKIYHFGKTLANSLCNRVTKKIVGEIDVLIHPGEWEFLQSDTEKRTLEEIKGRELEIAKLNDREVVRGLSNVLQWTNERFRDMSSSTKAFLKESRITPDMRYSTIRIALNDAFDVHQKKSFGYSEYNKLFETKMTDEIAKLMHLASSPASLDGISSTIMAQMLWIVEVRYPQKNVCLIEGYQTPIRPKLFEALIKRWAEAWKACKNTFLNETRLPRQWHERDVAKRMQVQKPADAKFNDGPSSDPLRISHWLLFNPTLRHNDQQSLAAVALNEGTEMNEIRVIYDENETAVSDQVHQNNQIVLITDFQKRQTMLKNNLCLSGIFSNKDKNKTKRPKIKDA